MEAHMHVSDEMVKASAKGLTDPHARLIAASIAAELTRSLAGNGTSQVPDGNMGVRIGECFTAIYARTYESITGRKLR